MKFALNQMHTVDALEGLRDLPDNSVDLIITDPAYDTVDKWREMGTTTRLTHSKSSSNDWFETVDTRYLLEVAAECFRVLKTPGHLYMMCDALIFARIHLPILELGFEEKKPLIWNKVGKKKTILCPCCGTPVIEIDGEGAPGMGYPFRSCYEMILLAQKGERGRIPEDKSVRDVLPCPRVKGEGYWPTQKPVDLLEVLVRQSSQEGDLVLDPFAGSGATLVAARKLGRSFLGFDKDPRAVTFFETRGDTDKERGVLVPKDPSEKPHGVIRKLFSRTKPTEKG